MGVGGLAVGVTGTGLAAANLHCNQSLCLTPSVNIYSQYTYWLWKYMFTM